MTPGESPNPRYKWLVVAVLWVVCFFNYADRQAIFAVFPLIKQQLQLTDVQLGVVGAAFMWMYALFGPLAGWLCDRLPRKTLVLAGFDPLVPGDRTHCRMSQLCPTGALPCPERSGRGGLSARVDVSDRRLSRSRHPLPRHVCAPVKRLCGLHRGGRPLRLDWTILWLAVELPGLRILWNAAVVGKLLKEPVRGGSEQAVGVSSNPPAARIPLLAELALLLRTRVVGLFYPYICRRELCGRGFSYLDAFVSLSQISHEPEHGRIERHPVSAALLRGRCALRRPAGGCSHTPFGRRTHAYPGPGPSAGYSVPVLYRLGAFGAGGDCWHDLHSPVFSRASTTQISLPHSTTESRCDSAALLQGC